MGAAAALSLALVGCSSGGAGGGGATTGDASSSAAATTSSAPAEATKPTEPVTVTMWTRSVTATQSQALVDEFNKTNAEGITVELTVVPFTDYLQKVSAAASGGNLPDILGGNVIDGPNYTQLGLWADITDKVKALDFADKLAPAHLAVGTLDDKIYAVPHVVDVSALYYNKVLFEKAGLDPDNPPTTLAEVADDAAKIHALDGSPDGLYFPGSCGGCLAFGVFPSIWAAGGTVMNADGTAATLDSSESSDVMSIYHDMWQAGTMAKASRDEAGATQNDAFGAGTVGFALLGSKALGTIKESDALKIGVAPIPGPDGGTSTFVGGDIVGISSTSKHVDAAWEFVKWTLSEQPQLDIYAKAGFMPVRTDLADNEYAQKDPRMQLLNSLVPDGQLPYSPRFFQTFNDAQGPFLAMIREAIFGSGPNSLAAGNAAVTDSLKAGS
jgi:multiple sugar transport system substrate-binding protein